MIFKQVKLIFCLLSCAFCFSASGQTLKTQEESIVQVSLRMLGHKILLNAGDSTSTVAPITKHGDRYLIGLGAEFVFDSGQLLATIDTVVTSTKLAKSYLVEVEKCDSNAVVYSFLVGQEVVDDIIPCGSREQDKACYNVYFTILQPWLVDNLNESSKDESETSVSWLSLIVMVIAAILFLGLYLKRAKQRQDHNPDLIAIGEYHFDKLNSELLHNGVKVELTSKESDLLLMLYNSVNTTVGREDILKNVWGDQGDYVGRTLDVFISKLRKKLEVDANIKIVNIRGVGYKMILNSQR